jgi:hypothetical protein
MFPFIIHQPPYNSTVYVVDTDIIVKETTHIHRRFGGLTSLKEEFPLAALYHALLSEQQVTKNRNQCNISDEGDEFMRVTNRNCIKTDNVPY